MFKKIFHTALQGFFWILPILLIVFIANWLFEKAAILTHILFSRTNANTEEYLLLWVMIGIIIIVLALSIIGSIATTRLASAFDLFIKKVPFYSTIKDIVDIFNSSKKVKMKFWSWQLKVSLNRDTTLDSCIPPKKVLLKTITQSHSQ
ncbi:conserved hypothetical protein, membrane [Bathymodiolus azoricus thioautotrophic gill symbiont]|uniref:Uncharacterized protein n=1 Tax=Bathymodiolus azoricus thioautotrophic gill symbiont TaxID=235205 RepID=A0A1H6KAX5_9GAMM|nr:conserved hypothetical protein, membrane [Bathymodiolus azoricus thioautotrophic gill symbiont]